MRALEDIKRNNVAAFAKDMQDLPKGVATTGPCGEGWVVKCGSNEPVFYTNWCDAYKHYEGYWNGR